MSRKIIIITREGDYDGNEPLVKMMPVKGKRGNYPSSCFFGLESIYAPPFFKLNEQDERVVDLEQLGSQLLSLGFQDDYLDEQTNWLDGVEEERNKLSLNEELVKVFEKIAKEEQCKYMDKIIYKDDEDEIYLFYWNKTKKRITDTWRILALICKDCGINFMDPTVEENVLYIHDDEWGKTGNEVLVFNHQIKSDENIDLLNQLINKFSFVASFQHNNVEGMIFHDILQCNFEQNMISNLLGEKEEKQNKFDYLRTACINVLEKSEK